VALTAKLELLDNGGGVYTVSVSWLPIGQQGYIYGTLSPFGWDDLQTVRQL
jgi:hypothetical protein